MIKIQIQNNFINDMYEKKKKVKKKKTNLIHNNIMYLNIINIFNKYSECCIILNLTRATRYCVIQFFNCHIFECINLSIH
jgi:hypothetical protein